ncbi:hypothetical protein OTU49_016092 [Cherax quadricarinatus]|uniref:EF-hand domain-containing protein n=1 Tax=Cherax quadricarinatus TaxID=27406 RepID=A0AAW0XWZ7_CHEQU
MQRGQSTGAGSEACRLVASLRAILGSKSCSEKSRSISGKEKSPTPNSCPAHPLPLNDNNKSSNNKSHRYPKSPFVGWRKLKLKESYETKENRKPKYVQGTDKVGSCSQSQIERISLHSPGNDTSTLAAVRDIRSEQSTYLQGQEHKCNTSRTEIPSNSSQSESNTDAVEINAKVRKTDLRSSNKFEKTENSEKSTISSAGNHSHNNVAKSASSSSESTPVSGVNIRSTLQDTCVIESDEERNITEKETRGQGDGSDNQSICCERKLGNDICTNYLRDMYKKGKPSNGCETLNGPLELDRELWLKSALSYNLQIPETPRNEVVVLALGIDQYVEEVFRYLDHSGTGRVSVHDMNALCHLLGFPEDGEKQRSQRCHCAGSNLTLHGSLDRSSLDINKFKDSECPVHLGFTEFQKKLCARFIRAAKLESILPLRCRRPNNPRLVTSVVSVQRRYKVLETISQSMAQMDAKLDSDEVRMNDECDTSGVVCSKCRQTTHVDRNSNISPQPSDSEISYLHRQILLQEKELQCLREVIEDMRIALQSSDAENLALQVKIKRAEESTQVDLSLTDEEDTIDNLMRQLSELDRQALVTKAETPVSSVPTQGLRQGQPESDSSANNESKTSEAVEGQLSTGSTSGDLSLEAELQATYEALQAAKEEQEAMQVDLQRTVGQLQGRESDLREAELRLRTAHSALEKAHHDNHELVMEIAETRQALQESGSKLTEAQEDLCQAKDNIAVKESQLKEAQETITLLRNFRDSVIQTVTSARSLVASSLQQVRAGEHALTSLATHSHHDAHPDAHPDAHSPSITTKLDTTSRADSGLCSEDSERDDDTKTSDRSSDPTSASEDDLWTPRHSGEIVHDCFTSRTSKGDDSSCSSGLGSPLSMPPEPEDDSRKDTRQHLMILEERELLGWKRSVKKDSPESEDLLRENARSRQWSSFTGPLLSSTTIIEGLEREVQWVQRILEDAERECEEVEGNVLAMDEEARRRLREVELTRKVQQARRENTRFSLTEDKLRQLRQALVPVSSSPSQELQLRQVLGPLPSTLSQERVA